MRFGPMILVFLMLLASSRAHAQRRGGESLLMEQIEAVVQAHWPAVLVCYRDARRERRDVPDRITINFIITPEGRATEITFLPDVRSLNLGLCIGRQLRRWQFPRLSTGVSSVVEYPFYF